jgi:hypothetical protein
LFGKNWDIIKGVFSIRDEVGRNIRNVGIMTVI